MSRRPEVGPPSWNHESEFLASRRPHIRLRTISMSTVYEVSLTGRDACAAKLGRTWPGTGRPLASAGSGHK